MSSLPAGPDHHDPVRGTATGRDSPGATAGSGQRYQERRNGDVGWQRHVLVEACARVVSRVDQDGVGADVSGVADHGPVPVERTAVYSCGATSRSTSRSRSTRSDSAPDGTESSINRTNAWSARCGT